MAVPGDITVVGAGIAGCSVAFELARRGASVQIVDERPAGMGATQASAGMLAPFAEAPDGGPLLELSLRSLHLFDAFVEHAVDAGGLPVPYRRSGTLDVALQDDEMALYRARAGLLAARGVAYELVDGQGAREFEPHVSGDAVGGLLIPLHGYVAAGALTRALASAARQHGAQILAPGRVRRVSRRGSDLLVETDRGSLASAAVVLAAGSWTGQIDVDGMGVPVPVRPVRGQLLHLAWDGEPLRRVTWGGRCYLVPWEDGTLLVGATVEDAGFDERATAAGVRDLIDAASELVPRVWTAGFRGARVGLRPGTPDGLPIIGPSPRVPNLFYATGHYRSGVLLAPLTAQLAAGALLDGLEDPALALTRPGRFGDL